LSCVHLQLPQRTLHYNNELERKNIVRLCATLLQSCCSDCTLELLYRTKLLGMVTIISTHIIKLSFHYMRNPATPTFAAHSSRRGFREIARYANKLSKRRATSDGRIHVMSRTKECCETSRGPEVLQHSFSRFSHRGGGRQLDTRRECRVLDGLTRDLDISQRTPSTAQHCSHGFKYHDQTITTRINGPGNVFIRISSLHMMDWIS
jgi:hypothetical protein